MFEPSRPRSSDILSWLILLSVVIASTSSALYVLHAAHAHETLPERWSCNDAATPFAYLQGSVLKIFEGSLIGEPYLDCMSLHNPLGSGDWWLAWLFAVLFQIIVGLLLVNMLIAKMAKTFDSIWENQGVNFM